MRLKSPKIYELVDLTKKSKHGGGKQEISPEDRVSDYSYLSPQITPIKCRVKPTGNVRRASKIFIYSA